MAESDLQPNDAEPVPDSTPAPGTAPNPAGSGLINGQPGEYWFKSYQGSQSKLREKDNSLKNTLADKNKIETEYHSQKAEWETQSQTLQQEREMLAKEKAALEAKLARFERRDSLRTLLTAKGEDGKEGKYAVLAPAFDSGAWIIPDQLEGDELTTFLDNAANYFKGVQSVSVTSVISGAAPSAPSGGQPAGESLEKVHAKLVTLQNEHKTRTPEYDALWEQYKELLRKQST
jgi:hypothetical protein